MRNRWRTAFAHACGGVAGIVMTVVETLRKPAPATIRRNMPRSFLAAMRPDPAIFAMATNRSCPGQIKIRPSAATGYPAISRVD
jgi:hypothetical protein